MSLIRKHGAVLQAWACLDLVKLYSRIVYVYYSMQLLSNKPIPPKTVTQTDFLLVSQILNDSIENFFIYIIHVYSKR